MNNKQLKYTPALLLLISTATIYSTGTVTKHIRNPHYESFFEEYGAAGQHNHAEYISAARAAEQELQKTKSKTFKQIIKAGVTALFSATCCNIPTAGTTQCIGCIGCTYAGKEAYNARRKAKSIIQKLDDLALIKQHLEVDKTKAKSMQ